MFMLYKGKNPSDVCLLHLVFSTTKYISYGYTKVNHKHVQYLMESLVKCFYVAKLNTTRTQMDWQLSALEWIIRFRLSCIKMMAVSFKGHHLLLHWQHSFGTSVILNAIMFYGSCICFSILSCFMQFKHDAKHKYIYKTISQNDLS